jgi:hypothetical protein
MGETERENFSYEGGSPSSGRFGTEVGLLSPLGSLQFRLHRLWGARRIPRAEVEEMVATICKHLDTIQGGFHHTICGGRG